MKRHLYSSSHFSYSCCAPFSMFKGLQIANYHGIARMCTGPNVLWGHKSIGFSTGTHILLLSGLVMLLCTDGLNVIHRKLPQAIRTSGWRTRRWRGLSSFARCIILALILPASSSSIQLAASLETSMAPRDGGTCVSPQKSYLRRRSLHELDCPLLTRSIDAG